MYTITEKDYAIVENEASAFHGVKLKTGTWKNVTVVYGQVGVREDETLDLATLSFNYTILDPAEFNIDELNEDEGFKNYLGAVLQYIITDSLEYAKENNLSTIGIGNGESTSSFISVAMRMFAQDRLKNKLECTRTLKMYKNITANYQRRLQRQLRG